MKKQLITVEIPCFNCKTYRQTPINLRPRYQQSVLGGGTLHAMVFHAEMICPVCDRDILLDGEFRCEVLPNDMNPAL